MSHSYKRPGSINAVSVVVVLLLAAGVYSAVRFTPLYYRKWKVREVLDETANKVYPRRTSDDASLSAFMDEISREAERRIRELGVEDRGLRVTLRRQGSDVVATADYRERISHPLVSKQTVLHFRPTTSISLKPGID